MRFDDITSEGDYTYVVKVKLKSGIVENGTARYETSTSEIVVSDTVSHYTVGSTPKYLLGLKGYLDGESTSSISNYGTVDVYINGTIDEKGVSYYSKSWPTGTKYEIKNIKAVEGNVYSGVHAGSVSGTIGTSKVEVSLSFVTSTPPVVFLDVAESTQPGTVRVRGWAFDPDAMETSVTIRVYAYDINGGEYFIGSAVANESRPDVSSQFGCGKNQGYDCTFLTDLVGGYTIRVAGVDLEGGTAGWTDVVPTVVIKGTQCDHDYY